MTQSSGTSEPTTGVTSPKSGRVADGKLVLWTDKGEPRVIRPVSVENKKLFVDAEAMLSLGARAELELPPVAEGEVRTRVRVEVVYSNPGKGSTTLRRGMLLAFPDLTDELLTRVNAAIAQAPRTSTIPDPAPPEKPKATKDEDTVYSKVPIAEPAAVRPAPEPTRRAEATRTNGARRAKKGGSLIWIPVLLALALAGVLGWFRYEDWVEHREQRPKPAPESVRLSKRPSNPAPEVKAPTVDPRYSAYLGPAREAAEALVAGDAVTLEGKLATAEKAAGTLAPEPASLRGLRAGREALRLRDTALDNIGQVRSLEGTAWGKGSNTPYRTKESFLKAQEARISVTKTTSAELANAALAILRAQEPWKAETDAALQDRIERTVRMLQLSQ